MRAAWWCPTSSGSATCPTSAWAACSGASTRLRGQHIVSALELLTGEQVPDWMHTALVRGAHEVDLVHSGLDDTMRVRLPGDPGGARRREYDYRTAAYRIALQKIIRGSMELGTSD
jgi:glutamate dehydrogenase (NAD(P)+)